MKFSVLVLTNEKSCAAGAFFERIFFSYFRGCFRNTLSPYLGRRSPPYSSWKMGGGRFPDLCRPMGASHNPVFIVFAESQLFRPKSLFFPSEFFVHFRNVLHSYGGTVRGALSGEFRVWFA
jgi:hypothetical protein